MQDFRNRLIKMHKHFSKWARKRDIHAYRIYDRDIPAYPFAIEIYEDKLSVGEYVSETVTSRKNYEDWRQQVFDTIGDATGVASDKIFVRTRQKQKGGGQYEKLSQSSDFFEVREGGLKFLVNLADYLDTGLFLDHRPTRAIIREDARDKNFLNLFCYTGAFSVYAAAGGARSTTSVDTSAVYLDWLEKNFKLNNISLKTNHLVRDDTRSFLEHYDIHKSPLFDLIFCDPPVFSSGKKLTRDFDVLRDHSDLIDACLRVLAPGGTLYFSTNFRKFRIQWKGNFKDISKQTIPDDFSNKQIHVCYKIIKSAS